jgi:hypothetical protein
MRTIKELLRVNKGKIYLPAKFFKDLIALRFNPRGPVAQYESVAWGISMLVCRSHLPIEAEYQQGYKKTRPNRQSKQRPSKNC